MNELPLIRHSEPLLPVNLIAGLMFRGYEDLLQVGKKAAA